MGAECAGRRREVLALVRYDRQHHPGAGPTGIHPLQLKAGAAPLTSERQDLVGQRRRLSLVQRFVTSCLGEPADDLNVGLVPRRSPASCASGTCQTEADECNTRRGPSSLWRPGRNLFQR